MKGLKIAMDVRGGNGHYCHDHYLRCEKHRVIDLLEDCFLWGNTTWRSYWWARLEDDRNIFS